MSNTSYPPFLKWGDYHSKDEKNPDEIIVEPSELEFFETEYSMNINANVDGIQKVIPIHNFESKNKQLLTKLMDAKKSGKIKVGKPFKILTWLGISKNKFPIRRFELIF